jgi:hypothetical protein
MCDENLTWYARWEPGLEKEHPVKTKKISTKPRFLLKVMYGY